MRGTVLYGTGDIRFEDTPEAKITKPTDPIIRLAATCVCGSDLWSYRGISPVNQPTPMGHEYCGIVEEVGSGIDAVLRFKIVGIGRRPMLIHCRTDLLISHPRILLDRSS
jgi:threonine dehydrogenase-like Zn-dependent dehydrogenase